MRAKMSRNFAVATRDIELDGHIVKMLFVAAAQRKLIPCSWHPPDFTPRLGLNKFPSKGFQSEFPNDGGRADRFSHKTRVLI
jgi:hypothetical protein